MALEGIVHGIYRHSRSVIHDKCAHRRTEEKKYLKAGQNERFISNGAMLFLDGKCFE